MTEHEPKGDSGGREPRRAEDRSDDGKKPGDGKDPSDDQPPKDWRDELGDLAVSLLGEERLKDLGDVRRRAERAVDVAAAGHLDDLRFIEKAEFHRARRDKALEDHVDPKSDRAADAERRIQRSVERLGGYRLLRDVSTNTVELADEDTKGRT